MPKNTAADTVVQNTIPTNLNLDLDTYGPDINDIVYNLVTISQLIRFMKDPEVTMDPIVREKELRRLIRTDASLRALLERMYVNGNAGRITKEQASVIWRGTNSPYGDLLPDIVSITPDDDDDDDDYEETDK